MSKRLTDRNREIPSLTAENEHFWIDVYSRLAKFEDAEEKEGGTVAADVVEVVRCRHCVIPHNRFTGCPMVGGRIVHEAFYCAEGRKS